MVPRPTFLDLDGEQRISELMPHDHLPPCIGSHHWKGSTGRISNQVADSTATSKAHRLKLNGAPSRTPTNPCSLPSFSIVAHVLAYSSKFLGRKPDDLTRKPTMIDHIKSFSLISLTSLSVMLSIVWLKQVLVPLCLAGFFMCQLEPLLFSLLNPASVLASCSACAARRAKKVDWDRVQAFSTHARNEGKDHGARKSILRGTACWKISATFALVTCVLFVLVIIAACLFLIWRSIETVDWQKYAESPKLKALSLQVKKLNNKVHSIQGGQNEVDYGVLLKWFLSGPIFKSFFNVTIEFCGTMFLTLLFLAFALISDLSSDRYEHIGLKAKARLSARRYVKIKTQMSLAVALLVWGVLEFLEVDLAFLFAFFTFILNYIPHIGYSLAVLLPLPLVYLDPTKTLLDVVWCVVCPILIHAVFSHFIEPKLLANSLDLHPVVILASLIFWTVVWGSVGAVLSVPLTSICRLMLLEVDHPYAVVVVGLFEGQWGPGSSRKAALGPVTSRENGVAMEVWMAAASPQESFHDITVLGSPASTLESNCDSPLVRPSPMRRVSSCPLYFASLAPDAWGRPANQREPDSLENIPAKIDVNPQTRARHPDRLNAQESNSDLKLSPSILQRRRKRASTLPPRFASLDADAWSRPHVH